MPLLFIATTNRDKLSEIRKILARVPVTLASLDAFAPIPEPDETGETFLENARLKAHYYDSQLGAALRARDPSL